MLIEFMDMVVTDQPPLYSVVQEATSADTNSIYAQEDAVTAANSQGAFEPGEVPQTTSDVPAEPNLVTEPNTPVVGAASEGVVEGEAPWETGPNPEGIVVEGESAPTPPPPLLPN